MTREAELLYTDEQEAGFVVISQVKGTGLVNLSRISLCREKNLQALRLCGTQLSRTLSAHNVNIHTRPVR